ncbi:hypothetical protein GCM10011390_15120 [Aureimonas endophytica]|uniref:Uncharacterized protein n=1 Tax=Aureimonas endophytica TaxID=2027858 RepID=A0A916ZI00_9HYPH|nr:hypothetical protein GCM10011390_15120 [Aureimonas endophytica]
MRCGDRGRVSFASDMKAPRDGPWRSSCRGAPYGKVKGHRARECKSLESVKCREGGQKSIKPHAAGRGRSGGSDGRGARRGGGSGPGESPQAGHRSQILTIRP